MRYALKFVMMTILIYSSYTSIAGPIYQVTQTKDVDYFIADSEGRYTQIDPPPTIECSHGKLFDQNTKSWRCATSDECKSETEAILCGHQVKNILIKVDGMLRKYSQDP